MALADLVADLKAVLGDAATVFRAPDDADFVRHLNAALPDMGWARPVTRLGQVELVAGEARYALAAYPDLVTYKIHMWMPAGNVAYPRPWELGYPGALPRVSAVRDGAASWLVFEPAPSALHVEALGSTFRFYYFGGHVLGEDAGETTVAPADRALLLLRAQAEAMREMAVRNSGKPVAMRDGFSGGARNMTPSHLFEALMKQFQEAAERRR